MPIQGRLGEGEAVDREGFPSFADFLSSGSSQRGSEFAERGMQRYRLDLAWGTTQTSMSAYLAKIMRNPVNDANYDNFQYAKQDI